MGVVSGRALAGPGVTVLRAAKVGGSEPDDHLLRARSLDGTGGNRSASRVWAADAPRSSGRGPRRAGGKSGELVPFLLRCRAGVTVGSGNVWARIERMEQDLTRADLPPRTMAAVAFGRSQSRSGPAGARAARETLRRSGLGVDEMKEIAFTAALTDFSNRAHTIPAIPAVPIQSMPDRF